MPRVERVEVRNVTRTFGATAALRGVELDFTAGRCYLLEGPNGAGKSTLLALISTALRPTSGEIRYPPFGAERENARREIGFVAHDSHCYRELGVRDNVAFAARIHGVDPAQAWERVAARVDVGHLAERRVGTLSRGQRQRAALARALCHGPSLLLLDEPFTGLDVSSAKLLERVLEEERDRGTLVIFVSHTDDAAERLGAHRVRLVGGRVAAA